MRIPSFNDFSPGIIGDVREPLRLAAEHTGDFDQITSAWSNAFFQGAVNKRARTNVAATLGNIGLFERKTASLTDAGKHVMDASNAKEGAERFIRHIIDTANGMLLIDALGGLHKRGIRVTKDTLKQELKTLGVSRLASGTTDHTTLLNWMVEAGLVSPRPDFVPITDALKKLIGISTAERSEFLSLPLAQQIFLKVLRRLSETETEPAIPSKQITDECMRDYPAHFDDDQFSAKVTKPLEKEGWISLNGRSGKTSGGKAGIVSPTTKLLNIPINQVLPDFNAVVPADLRAKMNFSRDEIQSLLRSDEKYDRGLGLELLTLRMLVDLNLQPRAFRLRSKDTAYAEIDLTAEGTSLVFSRWNWQCKCVTSRVSLGDVAKEVGLAIYSRSHVVAMVTTSSFSSQALAYAREITSATHLQFVFITGEVINDYLEHGAAVLLNHVTANATEVMALKRTQPIGPDQSGETNLTN